MKILITGGLGYLGRVLSNALSHHQLEIVDLKNGKDYRALERIEADAVVHLAAIVGDQACASQKEIARSTNFRGIRRLVDACKVSGVRRLVFASTCSIYGEDSVATCYEAGRINPLSLYATTKYAAERVLLKEFGDKTVILRFGTAFGQSPGMRYNLVINKFARQIRESEELVIYGGDQFRPFIHVSDIARAIQLALETPNIEGQIFNIASENICLKSVAWDIKRWYPDAKIKISNECHDRRSYKVSCEKAHRMLKFAPQVSIQEGIKEMVENE